MGRWSYNYNALGQLTQQTDAKAQSSSLQYDLLGRMITRTDTEGTTTWSYDSGTKAIGKFNRVTQSDGYIKEITYDALGRPTQVQTTINGVIHTSQTAYNAQGRVSDITYPSGLQIEQIYNNLGYLERVRRKDNQHTFWQANSSNQFGNITSATLGNQLVELRSYANNSGRLTTINTGAGATQNLHYEYDLLGNLTKRQDQKQNKTETFSYDALNRLTSSTGTNNQNQTYQYDALGNRTRDLTVANQYQYHKYDEDDDSPRNALNRRFHTSPSQQSISYQYDANGNQISSSDGRSIEYSSFNKPIRISKGDDYNSFAYGPDRSRYQQISQLAGVTTSTLYLGTGYEQVSTSSSTLHKHYIFADGRTIAMVTTGSESHTRYLTPRPSRFNQYDHRCQSQHYRATLFRRLWSRTASRLGQHPRPTL